VIRTFRQAIERDPEDALAHYVLATALSGNDQETEAVEEYRKAADLDPANATFLDHLAVSLAINGHPDDAAGAVEHFQMAVHAAPAWMEAWISLAAGLAVELRFSEAREAVATALRLDPANEQARKLSDRLAHDPAAQPTPP
jgi:Flp pilus assembly protein TadD